MILVDGDKAGLAFKTIVKELALNLESPQLEI